MFDERIDVPDLSLHQLLESYGLRAAASTGEIRATKLDPEEAKLLELLPGEPVVEVTTRTADRDGRSFEYARSLIRPGSYALLLQSEWAAT